MHLFFSLQTQQWLNSNEYFFMKFLYCCKYDILFWICMYGDKILNSIKNLLHQFLLAHLLIFIFLIFIFICFSSWSICCFITTTKGFPIHQMISLDFEWIHWLVVMNEDQWKNKFKRFPYTPNDFIRFWMNSLVGCNERRPMKK